MHFYDKLYSYHREHEFNFFIYSLFDSLFHDITKNKSSRRILSYNFVLENLLVPSGCNYSRAARPTYSTFLSLHVSNYEQQQKGKCTLSLTSTENRSQHFYIRRIKLRGCAIKYEGGSSVPLTYTHHQWSPYIDPAFKDLAPFQNICIFVLGNQISRFRQPQCRRHGIEGDRCLIRGVVEEDEFR